MSDDLKNEKLIYVSDNQRIKQYSLLTIGGLLSAIGGLHFVIDGLKEGLKGIPNSARKYINTDRLIGWSGVVLGATSIVGSFVFRQKAKKAEKKVELLSEDTSSFVELGERNFSPINHVSRLEKSKGVQKGELGI